LGWYEKNWKPVKLKNVGYSGGGFSASNRTFDWYSKLLVNEGKRKSKLDRYDTMDTTVDISRALDVIAEDISSDGADDDKTFMIEFHDESNPKETLVKTLKSTLNIWEKKTEFDYKFFDYIREMIKYGCVVFKLLPNGSLQKLIQSRIEGYKLSDKDDTIVTHYIYNANGSYTNKNGDVIHGESNKNNEKEIIKIENLLIIKTSDSPFGESILDNIYRVWKQLQLLEDAVIIYRVVRAPERRVFYIDVGKMPIHKAEKHLETTKNKIRQKQITRNGEIETDYNPASMQEDFYIAQTGEGRGSRVETLPGGENLGRIEDLQYFNKKLSLGLRIPPSYLDSYSDDVNGAGYSDGRVGTAYIAELRYVGYITRLQKIISKTLYNNFKRFAKKRGVDFKDDIMEDLDFIISPPQSFAIYKENELNSVLFNTYSSAESSESFSKKYSLKKYLNMDDIEITSNEDMKLMEMGYSKKEIKKFDEHERMNLVYGDGSAVEKEEKTQSEEQAPAASGQTFKLTPTNEPKQDEEQTDEN